MNTVPIPAEIDIEDLRDMVADGVQHVLLDVREAWEVAVCAFDAIVHVPMAQIPSRLADIPKTDATLVVVCHHGVRSLHAMRYLRQEGFLNATSLRGGIDAWAKRIDPAMATY